MFTVARGDNSFLPAESGRKLELEFDRGFPPEWVAYIRDFYNTIYPEMETFCGPPIRSGTLLVKFDATRPYLYYDRGRNAIIGGRLPKPSQGQQREISWDLSFAEFVSQAFCGPVDLFAHWAWGIHRSIANLVMMSVAQKGKLPVESQNWIYNTKTYDSYNYLGGDTVAGITYGTKLSGSPFWNLREGMFLILASSFPSKKTGQFDYLARVFKAIDDNAYARGHFLSRESYYYVDRSLFEKALDEAADGQRIDGLSPSEWVSRQAVTLEKGTPGPHLGVYVDDVDNPWRISVFAFDRRFNPRDPREGFEDPLKSLLVWIKVVDWKGDLTYYGNVTTGDDGRAWARPKWKLGEGGYAVFAEANYGDTRLFSRAYAVNPGQQSGVSGLTGRLLGVILDDEGEPISGSIRSSHGQIEFCRSGMLSIKMTDASSPYETLLSSNSAERRITKPATFLRIVPISALGVGSDLRGAFWGKVTDAETNLPLLGVEVRTYRNQVQKSSTITDPKGSYRLSVRGEDKYTIFAIRSSVGSDSGVEYVPSAYTVDTKTSRNSSINFRLHRGALIALDRQLQLIDMTKISSMNITILDGKSGNALDLDGALCTYGDAARSLGLNVRQIKVPLNREIRLKLNVSGTFDEMIRGVKLTKPVDRTFMTEETFYLRSGEKTVLDLRRLSMSYNLRTLSAIMTKATELLREAEKYGFYVVAEKKDLATVSGLSFSANEKLSQGNFDEGFSDVKEGYLKGSYLMNSISNTFSESYWSAQTLVFFLAFCASAIAMFAFDKNVTKLAGMVGTYLILWFWFYFIFPGCGIIPLPLLLGSTILALIGSVTLSVLLPIVFGKARGSVAHLSTMFSLAKRNLRRRKLRTALLVTTMMTLVLSFVALTSVSVEYGLEIKTVSATPPSDGVLVRENPAFDARFETLAEVRSDVRQWLSEREGVMKIVPKLESMPQIRIIRAETGGLRPYESYDYLGRLANLPTNVTMPLLGAVAFQPTEEPVLAQIRAMITAGRLFDETEKEVMISADAAQKYGFHVGDQLTLSLVKRDGREQHLPVTLVGLLDDGKLRAATDLDGQSIMPRVVMRTIGAGGAIVDFMDYCETTTIALVSIVTAEHFPGALSLSRFCVVPESVEKIPVLARVIALGRDMWTWASMGGRIQSMHLASYLETRGGFLVVPLALVALNLGAAMYMAISERKHETNTLSTLGVNPADITTMFLGEAIFIALLGAGVGYLSGLSFYKVVSVFMLNPEVRQKISAAWSIAVVILAMAVSLVGAHLPSKRAAVFSTPIGLARWRMEETFSELEGWRIRLPIKVETRELDGFMEFTFNRLAGLIGQATDHVERLKAVNEDTSYSIDRRLEFRFMFLGRGELRTSFGTGGFFIVPSQLAVSGKRIGSLDVELTCKVSRDSKAVAYQVADVLRKMALDWSTKRKRES